MKIEQRKNKYFNLKNSLILVIILAIAGAGVFYIYSQRQTDTSTTASGPTPEQQKEMQKVDNDKKKSFAEETKDVDNPGVTVPTPSTPDTIELTASKTDASTITVFTKLKNYPGGTCNLTVTNGSKTHAVSAQILYQPEYSSCAGFSVPLADLGAGTWNIKLAATPTGSEVVTKTITLEVK